MTYLAALRLVAVLIAIAGLADPAFTVMRPVKQPLAIVIVSDAANVGGAFAGAQQRLIGSLTDAFEISTRAYSLQQRSSACPLVGACVIVSAGTAPRRLTAGAIVLGAVQMNPSTTRGIRIDGVEGPRNVHLNAQSSVRVRLRRDDSATRAAVQLYDSGVLIGEETISGPPRPSTDGEETVTVTWVPMAPGPRRLEIGAVPLDTATAVESTDSTRHLVRETVDYGVDVKDTPQRVLAYQPEPSWLGTFVRRALEADSRFDVEALTQLAPGVMVSKGQRRSLDELVTQVSTVIVSSVHSLRDSDVDRLDRFVRVRGGSLVLLPDRSVTGPVTRLMPADSTESAELSPVAVGLLRASELLSFPSALVGTTVLEQAGGKAVIVSRATGRGRVIVSGAMDAWRYRDPNFARFWTTLVADASAAAGEPLEVKLADPLLMPGEETEITVELHTDEVLPNELSAEGTVECPSGTRGVRLWPGARRGSFRGTVAPQGTGACAVRVEVSGLAAGQARLLVASNVRRLPPGASLEAAIAAHHGIVVPIGDEARLIQRARDHATSEQHPQSSRPMRSPWWILPFTACIGFEWWLRRRRGLR
jgi:hypothetical protein